MVAEYLEASDAVHLASTCRILACPRQHVIHHNLVWRQRLPSYWHDKLRAPPQMQSSSVSAPELEAVAEVMPLEPAALDGLRFDWMQLFHDVTTVPIVPFKEKQSLVARGVDLLWRARGDGFVDVAGELAVGAVPSVWEPRTEEERASARALLTYAPWQEMLDTNNTLWSQLVLSSRLRASTPEILYADMPCSSLTHMLPSPEGECRCLSYWEVFIGEPLEAPEWSSVHIGELFRFNPDSEMLSVAFVGAPSGGELRVLDRNELPGFDGADLSISTGDVVGSGVLQVYNIDGGRVVHRCASFITKNGVPIAAWTREALPAAATTRLPLLKCVPGRKLVAFNFGAFPFALDESALEVLIQRL